MAISNRWISGVFLCLLLSLSVSASNETAVDPICPDDSAIRTSQYMTYYGCYNLSCFVAETASSVKDIDQCTNQCKNGSHSYAALFNGDWCSCGELVCGRTDIVCDSRCGVTCNASPVDFQTCGGKTHFQVYRDETSDGTSDGTSDKKSDLIGTLIKATVIVIVVIIVDGVIMICCTCILLAVRNLAQAASPGPSQTVNQLEDGDYAEIGPGESKNEATPYPFLDLDIKPERSGSADEYHVRRKRRQDRHRAESPTMPAELTSRRQRPHRRDNVYSITGLIEPHSVNITNDHSVSSLHLSSENAYDHTTASGRIQNTSNPDRGCNSLPRCRSSNSALPLRNRPGMQKVTEGDVWQGDDECSIRFATVQNDARIDFDDTHTCSVSTDPEYDYAAIPGLSNLRNLPCRCKPNQIRPNQEKEEGCGMVDNVLYNPS
eukprot:XP_011682154.1 PREDICTED: uncharacterized protein LOC105446705 [Strongylocentrotus purpuratus]